MKTLFSAILIFIARVGIAGADSSTTLCDALTRVSAGDQLRVTLSGIYETSFENAIFYDRSERTCDVDEQPVTTIEFSPGLEDNPVLDATIRRNHRAYLTVEGILYGPRPLAPDDLKLPVMLAYMNRVAARRYGHMGAFRTQLVVTKILNWEPVSSTVERYTVTAAKRLDAHPSLVSGELPLYPESARLAGISGDVVAHLTILNGHADAISIVSGDRLLADSVKKNITTWRFRPDLAVEVTCTFVFRLERRPTGTDLNTRVQFEFPHVMTITAAENRW